MQPELLPATEEGIRCELDTTKTQLNNLRRGIFGRFDKLVIELSTLQEDMLEIQKKLDISGDERDWK